MCYKKLDCCAYLDFLQKVEKDRGSDPICGCHFSKWLLLRIVHGGSAGLFQN